MTTKDGKPGCLYVLAYVFLAHIITLLIIVCGSSHFDKIYFNLAVGVLAGWLCGSRIVAWLPGAAKGAQVTLLFCLFLSASLLAIVFLSWDYGQPF